MSSATLVPSREKTAPKTLSQKEEDILIRSPLPPHMMRPPITGPLGVLQRTIFNVLCIASYGHVGLDPVWASIRLEEEGDDSVWVEGTRQICDRLNNLLVVLMLANPKGSLLLATSAAFITTVPPRPTTVDYTLRGPYICLLSAFGLLIGGIIVTAVSFLVLSKARPNWSERVLYSSRFHVYSTLIMLSYPIFSIGAATALLGSGILGAMWAAEDLALQASSPVILSMPIAMAVLFGVSYLTAKPETRGH
ncbi:hypothetical protein MVEN_01859900 [Mycena venus]|uniref:Uncharacterized protein n=1 Tax=Mycena venus TaxID=2733690 RepID=A0A8H6XHF5_9AGAR|nr:hypothetical protein MVEN_01859900 [Mycena venus]